MGNEKQNLDITDVNGTIGEKFNNFLKNILLHSISQYRYHIKYLKLLIEYR